MDIKLIDDSNRVVLRLTGRFDQGVSFEFFAMATKAMHRYPGRDIEVDLGGVDYLDSSGMGKLIHLMQELEKSGRRLHLLNPRDQVRKALHMLGVDKMMSVG